MGCDIHCYIEYRKPPFVSEDSIKWKSFGGRINPGRHYEIFAKLVGVRNYKEITPLSNPRGVPDDAGWHSKNDSLLYISSTNPSGEGNCSPENASKWITEGSSKCVDGNWVTNPDWHSGSWCDSKEIESVLKDEKYAEQYFAVLAAMKSFEQQGYESRLVFWFDN